jgi:uncharacterized protein
MSQPLDETVEQILSLSTMTLSTCGSEGGPHAAPVYFAHDVNHSLYFFSDPSSQHARHISVSSRAAAAIYPECQDWQDIRGLQYHGTVAPLERGAEWENAWKIYVRKFPFVSELRELVEMSQFYVFKPDWIRLVDNRQGFGYKREWQFS